MLDALLIEVVSLEQGSQAAEDAPAGDTTVFVTDTTPFVGEGGRVDIIGVVYDYVSVDEDAQALTLAEPLSVDVAMADPILVKIGDQIATDVYGLVDLGGAGETNYDDVGDLPMIPINESLPWAPMVYDPPLPVQVDEELTYLEPSQGVTPVLDGTGIDPATLPSSGGPTDPPTSSPVPAMVGNIRTLIGKFDYAQDATEYDIYVAAGTPVTDPVSGEVTGWTEPDEEPGPGSFNSTVTATQFQVTEGPARDIDPADPEAGTTTELLPDVGYYVAVVAKNDLGAAPVSDWAGPTLLRLASNEEISADYAYLGDVAFDQMSGGTFSATVAWAGLLKTREDEFAPGGELDAAGLRGYAPPENEGETAPVQVNVPFDGSPAYFAGDIEARQLTAYQGASFHGDANRIKGDGSLYVEAGLGGAVDGPQVTQSVPSVPIATAPEDEASPAFWPNGVPITVSNCVGLQWDAHFNTFNTVQNTSKGAIVWKIRTDGRAFWSGADWINTECAGVLSLPPESGETAYVWLGRRIGGIGGADWAMITPTGRVNGFYNQVNTTQLPALGVNQDDDSEVRIMEVYPGTGKVRVTRVDVGGTLPSIKGATASTDSPWAGKQRIGSVTAGTDMGLGPGFHHVYAHHILEGSLIRVSGPHTAFTEEPDLEWRLPTACVGTAYKNTGEAQGWYALGADGRLYRFVDTNVQTGEKARHVAAVTMSTSTAESQVGTKVAFDWQSRWSATVTAPPLIDPATRVGVYLYRGTGTPIDADMKRQGYSQSGSRGLSIGAPNYSGSAPGTAPTAGAYPLVSPATLRSEAVDSGGSLWRMSGDGSWKLGGVGEFPSADVPVISPFTTTGIQVVKVGQLVYLVGTFYRSSWSSESLVAAGTVPVGFRPLVDSLQNGHVWSASPNDAGVLFSIQVKTTGELLIRRKANTGSGMGCALNWVAA